MLKATVSGSFHRHMEAISAAVYALTDRAVKVLSPADPRIVDAHGEFLFVASDRVRSVRLVQDRHLEAIRCADFLWLVCPDGYVGQSASMELGFAAGAGIPVFAIHRPEDITLREYVSVVSSLDQVIQTLLSRPSRNRVEGLLIDPHASVSEAHSVLERIESEMSRVSLNPDAAERVHHDASLLKARLGLPTYLH